MTIPVAVVGMGNVGSAVAHILTNENKLFPDVELRAVVSRDPFRVRSSGVLSDRIPVYDTSSEKEWQNLPVKVVILCSGSATDIPIDGPQFVKYFFVVDSYDRHGQIDDWQDQKTKVWHRGYVRTMDDLAKKYGMFAAPCFGWDPGAFSINRIYFSALSGGAPVFSFYGCEEFGGRSMGHTQALRAIPGVKKAVQYTHANQEMLARARAGELKEQPFSTEMVWRECFIVLESWADEGYIRQCITTMPDYFDGYHTEIHFITDEEFFQSMQHDGVVLCDGPHGLMEYRNVFLSNPHATACSLIVAARATVHLEGAGFSPGAYTPGCIPPKFFLQNPNTLLGYI